jgi:hypothetical protein
MEAEGSLLCPLVSLLSQMNPVHMTPSHFVTVLTVLLAAQANSMCRPGTVEAGGGRAEV